jgi:hypothetical protein
VKVSRSRRRDHSTGLPWKRPVLEEIRSAEDEKYSLYREKTTSEAENLEDQATAVTL